MSLNVYQIVTDRIIAEMRNGVIPWQKPWFGTANGAYSYCTKKPYSMLNQFLLGQAGAWLTFTEIRKLHGKVKKGEHASIVTFWKIYPVKETKDGKEVVKNIPLLRYYNVFHESQIEGIEFKHNKVTDNVKPIDKAEGIIKNYVNHESKNGFVFLPCQSDRAYYSPMDDKVVVPEITQFGCAEEYYSTVFHEFIHSTLKKCRCDREEENKGIFGSESYSKEELVAEIGAASLVNFCGIETNKSFKNSVAYIESWIKKLENDIKFIVSASSRAEKAVNYILKEDTE